MTLAERIAGLFLPAVEPQRLRVVEGVQIDEAVLKLRTRTQSPNWNAVSVREALGVPAIFGAVSLISNTVGSLSLEAFRQGNLLAQEDAPRLIVRPNPFSTPRAFFRDTAFYLATRGEAWWWIAARDTDGVPMSLYPIPPWEITVAANDRNRLRPKITWGKQLMDNDDVRQITYLPGQDGLRGVGPMQLCGAAMSVTVESQEWAANFFSGALPSVIGTTEQDLSEDEVKALDKQWQEKTGNTPRWLSNGLTLTESPFDADKAQLTEQRQHQVGEAARMFSMPGALIEYQMGGSSLTYQNQADVWQDLQRRCLSPHYLEPIEQEISDLLTRATVARFNLKQLLRADPKSRFEVHTAAITAGIYDAATAAKEEGYAPGAVDYAPVPLALPQATPSLLPINRSAQELRCAKCHRMLAEAATPPYRIACPRCKTVAANDERPQTDMVALLMRAMQPAPATIEVHPPNVTVNPPTITFERGAIQVDAPEPAEPATVNVSVAAPDFDGLTEAMQTLADRPAPNVTVEPAQITIESPQVTVEAPNVNVTLPEPRPITRNVKRDKANNIIRIEEVPA